MICYKCGGKLGSGNRCLHCGADVTIYRKIIGTSNSYYNAGLEKAQLRDLTGAIECLETALQYNKKNTDARNLLGLIWFEMGEVCEALSQWIVSKNLQPRNNMCDEYLNLLKKDGTLLEDLNQAVKKYNLALEQARVEGSDIAVITLKRVIKQQPHMVKAYLLLALLYMQNEEYSRANRLLKKVLEIDKGNTMCQTYMRIIKGKLGRSSRPTSRLTEVPQREEYPEEEEQVSRLVEGDLDEPIVPHPIQVTFNGGLRTSIAVIIGMVIALFMYQFVILRTVNRDSNVTMNDQIIAYENKLSDRDLQIQSLQKQLEAYEGTESDGEETVTATVQEQYAYLIDVVNAYITSGEDADAETLTTEFKQISRDTSASESYQSLYDAMYQYVMVDLIDPTYEKGLAMVKKSYYTKAIPVFQECLDMNPDYDKAIYYLGVCYQHKDEDETAEQYFAQIVLNYPDSEFYDKAVKVVGENPVLATGNDASDDEAENDENADENVDENVDENADDQDDEENVDADDQDNEDGDNEDAE